MKPVFEQISKRFDAAAFLLVLSTLGCGSASEITAAPTDALVVDVRTKSEFDGWHYPGAINISVQSLEQNLDMLPDKNKSIVVYCRSGHRATRAKQILIENGYTDVKNGGGLSDMRKLAPAQK
jgi:phage shock protein E